MATERLPFGGPGAEFDIAGWLSTPDMVRQAYPQALSNAYNRAGSWIYDPYEAEMRDSRTWDKIRKDLTYAAAIEFRCRAIAGRKLQAVPASDQQGDRAAGKLVDDLFKLVPFYTGARKMLAESDFLGEQWMVMTGTWQAIQLPSDTRPRRWWVPGELHHVRKERFRLVPHRKPDGELTSVRQMWAWSRRRWEILTPQARAQMIHHVYEKREEGVGYPRGLMSSLYPWWKLGTLVLEKGMRACDRFVEGILDASIKGMRIGSKDRTNVDQVEKWMRVLGRMRSGDVLVHDIDEPWDIKWPSASIVDIPLQWKRYFDEHARSCILASDSATGASATGKAGGSYAQTQAQKGSMADYFSPDRDRMGETLDRSQLDLMWRLNENTIREALFEAGHQVARRPGVLIDTAERMTPKEAVEILKGMQEIGMSIARDWGHELVGAPIPGVGDAVLEAPQQDQGMGGFGGGGFGGGGLGDLFGEGEENPDEPTAVGEGDGGVTADGAPDEEPQIRAQAARAAMALLRAAHSRNPSAAVRRAMRQFRAGGRTA